MTTLKILVLDQHEDDDWKDLPEWVREAAKILGYTKKLWNKDREPPECSKDWKELSDSQDSCPDLYRPFYLSHRRSLSPLQDSKFHHWSKIRNLEIPHRADTLSGSLTRHPISIRKIKKKRKMIAVRDIYIETCRYMSFAKLLSIVFLLRSNFTFVYALTGGTMRFWAGFSPFKWTLRACM